MADEKDLKLLFWIGTLVMLCLTFAVVLIAILYQRRVYRLQQDEARKLMFAALKAEHKERSRLAAGLHDGICGDINAIRNFVSVLGAGTGTDKELLQEIRSALDIALANVREFSYNLMPPLLHTSGLVAALKEYLKRMQQSYQVSITGSWPTAPPDLSDTEAYELYLVVQELMTNAIKHGKASVLRVTLSDTQALRLSFEDNGPAFDFYQCLKNSGGLGLSNICSRLNSIRARLEQETVFEGNKMTITLHGK